MNEWMLHVKRYKKLHPKLTFKQVLVGASKTYKQKGKGILPDIRKGASPSIRKFLADNGDKKIVKLEVGRKPIFPAIQKIVNLIPAAIKSKSYDTLFHLFLIVRLDDGSVYRVEKNHLPEISRYSPAPKTEIQSVATPFGTFAQFWSKGEGKAPSPEEFYIYDSVFSNCQFFTQWLLKGSGVWTAALNKFVMQDAAGALDKFGFFKNIARKATDLANRFDVWLRGKGKKSIIKGGCCDYCAKHKGGKCILHRKNEI